MIKVLLTLEAVAQYDEKSRPALTSQLLEFGSQQEVDYALMQIQKTYLNTSYVVKWTQLTKTRANPLR